MGGILLDSVESYTANEPFCDQFSQQTRLEQPCLRQNSGTLAVSVSVNSPTALIVFAACGVTFNLGFPASKAHNGVSHFA
jgi:hypothetical protein